jgi:hypothetical protein
MIYSFQSYTIIFDVLDDHHESCHYSHGGYHYANMCLQLCGIYTPKVEDQSTLTPSRDWRQFIDPAGTKTLVGLARGAIGSRTQ